MGVQIIYHFIIVQWILVFYKGLWMHHCLVNHSNIRHYGHIPLKKINRLCTHILGTHTHHTHTHKHTGYIHTYICTVTMMLISDNPDKRSLLPLYIYCILLTLSQIVFKVVFISLPLYMVKFVV